MPGSQTAHRSDAIPLIANRSFEITTRFQQRPDDEGILWALGDTIAGMVMYVEANRLNFHYNGFSEPTNLIPSPLPEGKYEIIFAYEVLGKRRGRGRLLINNTVCIDWIDLSPSLTLGPFEGMDVGLDRRAPVFWELYERHGVYPYTGKIDDVWIYPGLRATT